MWQRVPRDTARPHDGGSSVAPSAPGQQTTPASCDSYLPGHLMHYTHQGRALRSSGTPARYVAVDGSRVTVELDGEDLRWRHHDPERLERLLCLVLGGTVVYREHHALRVGPYWFNCAPGDDSWSPCRPG